MNLKRYFLDFIYSYLWSANVASQKFSKQKIQQQQRTLMTNLRRLIYSSVLLSQRKLHAVLGTATSCYLPVVHFWKAQQ